MVKADEILHSQGQSRRNRIIARVGSHLLFIIDYASNADQNGPYAKLANSALKRQFDLGKPDVYEIQRLVSAHDFKSIEKVYDGYLEQYKVDVAYEGILLEAYKSFHPNMICQKRIWIYGSKRQDRT